MKKILAVLITLVLAGSAFAVVDIPDVQFAPQVGGLSEITVVPSDTFYVDILGTACPDGDAWLLIHSGKLVVTIDGPAEFIGNEDLTYWSFWADIGANHVEYVDSQTLIVAAGYVSQTQMFMMPFPDIAIDHIGIHCTDLGDVTITVATTNVADALGNVVYLRTDELAEKDMESIGGSMIVHQVPEPMTVLLLGLGGLFLRRRK